MEELKGQELAERCQHSRDSWRGGCSQLCEQKEEPQNASLHTQRLELLPITTCFCCTPR